MKRVIPMALLICLMLGVVTTAEAGKRKRSPKTTRAVQATYLVGSTSVVGNCTPTDGVGCMALESGPGEVFITAKVTDAHGQPVSVQISADLDGDVNTDKTYGTFCGETSEPIAVDPGVELVFWIGRADVAVTDGCAPGIATQGTLDIVFSNRR